MYKLYKLGICFLVPNILFSSNLSECLLTENPKSCWEPIRGSIWVGNFLRTSPDHFGNQIRGAGPYVCDQQNVKHRSRRNAKLTNNIWKM